MLSYRQAFLTLLAAGVICESIALGANGQEPTSPEKPAVEKAGPPPSPALTLTATPRAGYAIVSASGPTTAPIQEIQWIITASATTTEVAYDTFGTVLVVTLPNSGSVTVYAVGLLTNGRLTVPASIDLTAQPGNPIPTSPTTPAAPPPTQPANTNLRITLAVNLAALKPAEDALLRAQDLKQGLTALGHRYLFTDVNAPAFTKILNDARQTNPRVPQPTDAPFLFIQDSQGRFHSSYKLTLGSDAAKNVSEILGLFRR